MRSSLTYLKLTHCHNRFALRRKRIVKEEAGRPTQQENRAEITQFRAPKTYWLLG